MFIIGYKALNKDFTNRYGIRYEIGTIYQVSGEIKWGNNGNGFHLCTHIEDCYRYVNSDNSIMTEVIGFGKLLEYDDEYYGYYDMYVCENLKVVRVIPREEIISMMLNANSYRKDRFIRDFNLTEEELELFKGVGIDGQNSSERCKRKQFKKY